jgi:hypothetical protein
LQMILLFFDWGFPDTPPEEPAVHLIVRRQTKIVVQSAGVQLR